MKDLTQEETRFLDKAAIAAMQAYMRNCEAMKVNDGYIASSQYKDLAGFSYDIAEAMLEERRKRYEDNKEQQS